MTFGVNQDPVTNSKGRIFNEDRKAMPELLLKQKIAIIDFSALIESFKKLEKNRRINHGQINPIDKAEFEGELIGLFLDIKYMIQAKKKHDNLSEDEKRIYGDLNKLVSGMQDFELKRLISMMSYLLRQLHVLNLTNLLISEKDPFDDWKNS